MNETTGAGPEWGSRVGQFLPNGLLEDNYPRNMWWVAALAEEITEKPMARWLLELPIVLYRTADGTPVALDDRCAHRWAPLSGGRVEGSEIICPYHGMAYGTNGVCTRIPTQGDIPDTARVRSYPLRENGAFVWIWMGDPGEIENHDPPVDMAYTMDPDWSVVIGYYDVAANWILIRENVLDLTHIAHLHRNTFRQDDWNSVPEIRQQGDVITFRQEFGPGPLSPLFCHALGFGETKPVSRVQIGTMPSLGVSFSDWFVHDPAPEPGARSDFLVRGFHVTTPGERGRTHYYWSDAFDIADVPDDVIEPPGRTSSPRSTRTRRSWRACRSERRRTRAGSSTPRSACARMGPGSGSGAFCRAGLRRRSGEGIANGFLRLPGRASELLAVDDDGVTPEPVAVHEPEADSSCSVS